MAVVTLCLVLLLAVVLSGVIARMLPAMPRPLVQIAFGAGIALVSEAQVALNPELFFLLFVPPLLFLDGWRIPKDELLKDRTVILGLALGLVFLTVAGMGWLIHWLIPAMPLPVSFALASVISPTDPIAVSAIAQKVSVPKRMMHILEGEALLNDASGLVCLRFAIAAALTGHFSFTEAALSFEWMALAGIAIAVAITWGVMMAKAAVARRFGDDAGSNILVSLLVPFAAYLAAEHIEASGVLAAAAAGITMTFTQSSTMASASTRIRSRAVWDMLEFTLNGVIFVLLGEQLPEVFGGAQATVMTSGRGSPWWLALDVVVITAGLALLRFGWVWIALQFTLLRQPAESGSSPPLRIIAAMSCAGARGAVTLAGILTLPLALADGTAFPTRDLAIFIACGVILASLVVASAGLPLLLRGLELPGEDEEEAALDRVRIAAAQGAIKAIEALQHRLARTAAEQDHIAAAAAPIMDLYRTRIDSLALDAGAAGGAGSDDGLDRIIRLAGVRAERRVVHDLVRKREIGATVADRLLRPLDLLEAHLVG